MAGYYPRMGLAMQAASGEGGTRDGRVLPRLSSVTLHQDSVAARARASALRSAPVA